MGLLFKFRNTMAGKSYNINPLKSWPGPGQFIEQVSSDKACAINSCLLFHIRKNYGRLLTTFHNRVRKIGSEIRRLGKPNFNTTAAIIKCHKIKSFYHNYGNKTKLHGLHAGAYLDR